MTEIIAGIRIPDSAMARAATQLVRDTEDDLLYNHSRRVFLWGALTGERRQLRYDPELLYIGAMFHDMGLTPAYASEGFRFEVDGANAARDFLQGYGIPERDIEDVWTAIALHTTPGVPEHMRPTIALVTAGVEMDVLGLCYTTSRPGSASMCARTTRASTTSRKASSTISRKARAASHIPPLATSRRMCSR